MKKIYFIQLTMAFLLAMTGIASAAGPFRDDAGITSFSQPPGSICPGLRTVKVTLKNFGTDTLKMVSISWMVNGVPQTSVAWTGNLPADSVEEVTLGSNGFLIPEVDTLMAMTSLPNGISDSATSNDIKFQLITVNSLPAAAHIATSSVCAGSPISIGAASVTGSTYAWTSSPSGFTSTDANPSASPTVNTTYYLTETNAAGCVKSDSLTINMNALPTPTITGMDTICAKSKTSYSTIMVAGNSYKWSIAGGTITSGANLDTANVTWGINATGMIMLKETNAAGCSDSVSMNIVLNPLPIPSINGSLNVCTGANVSYTTPKNTGSTYAWTITGATVNAGGTTDSVNVSWGAPGSGSIIIRETNAIGCTDGALSSVKIFALPTAAFSGDTMVCANGTKTYTASSTGNIYTWTVNGGTIVSGAGTNSVSVTWTSAGTIMLKEATLGGCMDSSMENITISGSPTPTIAGIDTLCAKTATSYSTTSNSGSTYSWTISNGTILSGSNLDTVQVKWGSNAGGTIMVKETNATGCSDSAMMSVIFNPLPIPSITGSLNVCAGNTLSYTTPKNSGSTYAWTITGATVNAGGSTDSVNVTWGAAGSGSITIFETNANGCKDGALSSVKIFAAPAATFSGDTMVCQNSSEMYIATSTGNTYMWSVTGGTIVSGAADDTLTVMWPTTGAGTVMLKEANAGGCMDSTMMNISINAKPSAGFTGTTTVCIGASASYMASSTGNTYVWKVKGGTITFGTGTDSIAVSWTSSGAGSVMLTESNAAGCMDSSSVGVTVQPVPTPSITGKSSVCSGSTESYMTAKVSGNGYTWSVSGGTIASGSGTDSITVTWGASGTGSVKVIENNTGGCMDSAMSSITIGSSPAPVIAGLDTLCAKSNASYSTTSNSGSSYSWTISNGTIISGANLDTVQVKWGTNAGGSITVKETNAAGCTNSAVKTVVFNPLPTPSITGSLNVCTGATVSYMTAKNAGSTYAWTITGATVNSGGSTDSVNVTWGAAGSGSIVIFETNANGCKDGALSSVKIFAAPAATFSGDTMVCQNSTEMYVATSTGNTYTWSVTGGTIVSGAADDTLMVMWPTTGAGTVMLKEANAGGCMDSSMMNITILAKPSAGFTGTTTVCIGASASYMASSSGNTYVWKVKGGTITFGAGTDSIAVSWTTSGAGNVMLTESNAAGCMDSSSVGVTVQPVPTPTITGKSSVCAGSTQSYMTAKVSGNGYTWSVSGGTIASGSGTDSITVKWGAAGTGSVKVIENNKGGCVDSSMSTITINALPTPTVSGLDTLCAKSTASYSTTSNTGSSYSWTITGGTATSGANLDTVHVTWGNGTSGMVMVKETNANGCMDSAGMNIVLNALPTPVITGTMNVCAGVSGSYMTAKNAGSSYSWAITGGTINAGSTTDSINVTWGSVGTGTLKVTETNANGCSDVSNATIKIFGSPSAVFAGDTMVCNHAMEMYIASVAGNTYTWSVVGGNVVSGAGNDTVTVQWTTLGVGSVMLKVANPGGCMDSAKMNVTVNSSPSTSFSGSSAICGGGVESYMTTSTGNTYNWTVTGGTITAGAGTDSIVVSWPTTGAGSVMLTETNAGGCKDSASINVTVYPVPTPAITGKLGACSGSRQSYKTAKTAGNSYTWSVFGGTIAFGAGTDSITVTWAGAGAGSVKVIESNPGGCMDSTQSAVSIFALPTPTISGIDTLCAKSSANYNANTTSGSTYAWTITGGTATSSANLDTVNVTWGNGPSGMVMVKETNANGCMDSAGMNIVLNALPTPVITGSKNVCDGTTGSYMTAKNAGSTYSWTITGGTINAGSATDSVNVTWGSAGTGSLKVTETNNNGCTDAGTATIKIFGAPSSAFSGDTMVCHNTTEMYTATVSGNTYTWTVTGGTIVKGAGTDSLTINWGTVGTGSVMLKTANLGGCMDSSSMNVVVNANPVATVSGIDTICVGGTTSYMAGTKGNTYNWKVSGGTVLTGAGTDSISVMWTSLGSGSVMLTETNASGCMDSVTLPISVVSGVNPAITGNKSVCPGSTYGYQTAKGTGLTYTWSLSGGSIISGAGTDSVTVKWASAGVGIIKVVESNAGGCTDSSTIAVTINSLPTPSITGMDTVCAKSGTSYNANTKSGSTYSWKIIGGTATSGAATDTVNVTWGNGTSGMVMVTETNANGCMDSVSMNIVLNALPTPVITGSKNVCDGASTSYMTAKNSGSSYSWTVNGGTINFGAFTDSIDVSWGTAGTGSVTVIETNANGCMDSSKATINIFGAPSVAFAGDTMACNNTISRYTAKVTGNTNTWTVNGGTVVSGAGTDIIMVKWTSTGANSVMLKSANAGGCMDSSTMKVVINAAPLVSVTGIDTLCVNTVSGYMAGSKGNTYKWTVTGGTISSGAGTDSIVVAWNTIGAGSVMLTETNASGCSDSISLPVVVQGAPAVSINGFTLVCTGANGIYSAPAGTNLTYNWTVTGATITAGAGKDSIYVTWGAAGGGSIKVVISNSTGCMDSATSLITINALPTPSVSGNKSVCAGTTNGYSASTKGNTYAWTATGGTIISASNKDSVYVTWGSGASGDLKLVETGLGGCKDSSSFSVTINAAPAPAIKGAGSICSKATNSYQTAKNTGNTYSWTVTGGTIASGAGTDSITVSWGASGAGSVKVVETNAGGCKDSSTVAVTINALPVVAITPINVACSNKFAAYKTTSATGNTYSWSITGGAIVAGAGSDSVYVKWGASGSASLSLKITNASGCMDSSSNAITVNASPTAAMTANRVCFGASTQFNNTTTGLVKSYWSFGDGDTSTSANPLHKYKSAGIYAATLAVVDAAGCYDTATNPIRVDTTAMAGFTASTLAGCDSLPVSFTDTSKLSTSVLWHFGNGKNSTASAPSTVYHGAGTYTVWQIATSNAGCKDSVSKTVTVYALPNAKWNDSASGAYNNIHFYALDTLQSSYSWVLGNGKTDTGHTITHLYAKDSVYMVTLNVTSAKGCKASFTDSVVVMTTAMNGVKANDFKLSMYPNPFTESANLTYTLTKTSHISIRVYDMNGKLVNAIVDEKQMAGKYNTSLNGSNLPAGLYLLKVQVDNNEYNQQIIRLK